MKLALFVQHSQIVCYDCNAAGIWTHQRIKGETAQDFKPDKAATALSEVLKDQSNRIHQQHDLRDIEVYLAYAQSDVAAMTDAPKTLAQLHCNTWQILQLESLLQRAAATSGITPKAQSLTGHDPWLQKWLLPQLISTLAYGNKALEQAEAQARQQHEDTMESLREDVQRMHRDKAQLQAHISALQLPSVEHLVVYLPAIYRNFWGVVRPDELALLAGTLTVPVIASPYPDPSPDTVLALRRRFLQLPELDRERVLGFCRDLPHRLDVRPEMRDLFGEI